MPIDVTDASGSTVSVATNDEVIAALLHRTATTATALTGTTTSTISVPTAFTPQMGRPIILTLWGTWDGSVSVLRSIDNGSTKYPITKGGVPVGQFFTNCNEFIWTESEAAAKFYLDIVRNSGTINYRLAQ